jgi:hypothetical protein
MKKYEIRVTIDSTEKQQKAIEILNRYNEPIWQDEESMDFLKDCNSLVFVLNIPRWWIGDNQLHLSKKEITLEELETILKNESK